MITETFLHIPGIGPKTAGRLHEAGIRSWRDAMKRPEAVPLRGARLDRALRALEASDAAFRNDDIGFFVERFRPAEHWRILGTYLGRTSFFDIETSGLSRYEAEITVVVCFHRGRYHRFVRGENLEEFLDLLDEVDLLVSFNGNCFDIPFVEDAYRIPALPCPHVDLRWVAYHAGLRGSLDRVEEACGITRPPDVAGIDGVQAVILWNAWKRRGDRRARDLLLDYCTADVEALRRVAEVIVGGKAQTDQGSFNMDI